MNKELIKNYHGWLAESATHSLLVKLLIRLKF